jgi:hypothetical protein
LEYFSVEISKLNLQYYELSLFKVVLASINNEEKLLETIAWGLKYFNKLGLLCLVLESSFVSHLLIILVAIITKSQLKSPDISCEKAPIRQMINSEDHMMFCKFLTILCGKNDLL